MNSPIVMVSSTPARRDHHHLIVDVPYTTCHRLHGCTSKGRAKALHSAVEKRVPRCAMKRDCARHERRRRFRRGRGRSHRHLALFSCTELGSQK